MTVSIDEAAPRPLPTDMLSFLFTDVVDSTALWEQAPDVMDSTLARHDEIIYTSVARHGDGRVRFSSSTAGPARASSSAVARPVAFDLQRV